MLTKQAQEEIFNSYYNQGVDLALGQVKVAGKSKKILKAMLQTPATGLGAIGGFGAAGLGSAALEALSKQQLGEGLENYFYLMGGGLGALGAHNLSGK